MSYRTRLKSWWLRRRPITQTWLAGPGVLAVAGALTWLVGWLDDRLQPVGAFVGLFIIVLIVVVIPLAVGLLITGMEEIEDEF